MRAGIVALLTILAVVAVSAEARYKTKLEKWEKFFEEDPLGQKISDHYAELKELIKEVRQRIRKQLAKYVKQLKSE
ncbi:hypothetical protein EGR_10089 [Echinococcus granulosus]|uniref:Uncharacterized protein n=1 Tax=Echinococcus granulosus TaxID=6210 RepID=W6UNU2_ECHGR|nr:hypothetical protein EGR_10089 [Echinococcus granulosus]EUB55044.1 hypothetical protein EGR_10089 [Echinococcus granulosus]